DDQRGENQAHAAHVRVRALRARGAEELEPIPAARSARSKFLVQIADECIVRRDPAEQCGCESRRTLRRHTVPPFSCGIPDQSAVKARCVSLTALSPFDVTLKYRFARPPRSGVGSP